VGKMWEGMKHWKTVHINGKPCSMNEYLYIYMMYLFIYHYHWLSMYICIYVRTWLFLYVYIDMPHFASQALVVAPGLSTASGIGDYASKAGGSIAPHKQHGGVIAVNTPRFLPLLRTFFFGGNWIYALKSQITLYIYIYLYIYTYLFIDWFNYLFIYLLGMNL
jgi:hypothetical protein